MYGRLSLEKRLQLLTAICGGTGTQVFNNCAQGNLNTGYRIGLSGPNAIRKRASHSQLLTGIIGYASGDIIERNKLVKDRVS